MDWHQLLNKRRLGGRPAKDESGRNAFMRDHDKIVFSGAFRRLARKTQVHPLATNDHVHNRLTHSLEVSCVGRTLGIRVGNALERHGLLPDGVASTDLGDIVQSACLAHDIGNPPFGHTGERAIRSWFQEQGTDYLTALTPDQRLDLEWFEGNAQGFRVLTQTEYHQFREGMRLTYATLGTFLKYPWPARAARAGEAPRADKFSVFQAECHLLDEIAEAIGVAQRGEHFYSRHPLTFLMEAADDFCYGIIDLEDGLEMELLQWPEVAAILRPVLPDGPEVQSLLRSDLRPGRKAALLRGAIIEGFIEAGVDAFIRHHDALLAGEIHTDLISLCESAVREAVESAKRLARERVFEHPRKVELEIGAYQVIGTLLDHLVAAAAAYAREDFSNFRHQRLINLMGAHSFPAPEPHWSDADRQYHYILRAVDFLAGMTDNYATYLAKQFNGLAELRY